MKTNYISWKPGPRSMKRFYMHNSIYDHNHKEEVYNNSVNKILKSIRSKRLGTKRKNYRLFNKYEKDIKRWIYWKKLIKETPWKILVYSTYKVFLKHVPQQIVKNFEDMLNLTDDYKKRVRRLIIANYNKFSIHQVYCKIKDYKN